MDESSAVSASGSSSAGPAAGTESPLHAAGVAVGLGVLGMVLLVIVSVLIQGVGLFVGVSEAALLVVSVSIAQYVGFVGLALVYLRRRGLDWAGVRSYLGVRVPTLREVGVVAGGYVVLIVVLVSVAAVVTRFLPEPAENQAAATAAQNPEIIPVLVVVMFLVVGPCEEVLYRGIVQQRLRERLSVAPAIAIAAAVFAAVHVVALAGSPSAMAVTIVVLFFPGLVLGAVYEYTGNIVVPALLHSIHNSVLVTLLFFGSELEEAAGVVLALV